MGSGRGKRAERLRAQAIAARDRRRARDAQRIAAA
jgi:hypothetical protein